jgi:hypothetical protein
MIRPLLLALALAAPAGLAAQPRLEPEARIVWREPVEGFGGFSAIEVLDAGARFVTVSDRGRWATGTMARTEGVLTSVGLTGFGPLLSIAGDVLVDDEVDAEGLAMDADGRFHVSFEAFHRIRRYDRIDGPATAVPSHPDFPGLQNNSALEALAIDGDGTLYTIPERSGAWTRPFPVYRFRDGAWDRRLSLPRVGTFLVSGADFGPDGRLYLLERDFRRLGGFATRIRRFTLGPDGFDAGETLLETEFGSFDNFEGISVWRDAAGVTRATLITDDNFFALQSTVIAEYRLVED